MSGYRVVLLNTIIYPEGIYFHFPVEAVTHIDRYVFVVPVLMVVIT